MRRSCLVAAVISLSAITCLAAVERKPVALAGASYGIYEKKAIVEGILKPNKIGYEDKGSWIEPAEFSRYSLVILATKVQKPDKEASSAWTAEDIRAIDAYLKSGGHLMIVQHALMEPGGGWPKGLRSDKFPFFGAGRFGYLRKPIEGRVLDRDSPYTRFLDKDTYSWTTYNIAAFNLKTARPLVGAGEGPNRSAGIFVNAVGDGKVFFIGMELFRRDKKDPDTKLYRRIVETMILSADPATLTDEQARRGDTLGKPFVVWQPTDEPKSDPAFRTFVLPLADAWPEPGVKVPAIHLDLARAEKESCSLLVSASSDLELEITAKGPEIVRSAMMFRRTTDHNKLVPLQNSLQIGKGRTEEVWIRFSSHGIRPGEYTGAIEFAGQNVPVSVKVWNTVMPEKNLVRVQPYGGAVGFVNSLTGSETADEKRKAQFEAYFANMRENRIDTLELYFNRYTIWRPAKIDGRPIHAALKDNPSLLEGEDLPEIDLSYYDPYFAIAKKHGLGDYIVLHGSPALYSTQLEGLGKQLGRDLSAGTPEYRRLAVWLVTALRTYLERQGAKQLYAKVQDEIGPKAIPSYKASAELFQLAGWRPFTTWTGAIPQTPDLIRKVNPDAFQWQIQFLSLDIFRNLVNAEPALIDPTDEISYYGGGSKPYRFSYLHTRKMGWLAGYYNVEGFGFWTYRMWHSKGEGIVFYEDGKVYGTPALEGLRDAIEDAQLYAMLNRRRFKGDKRTWTPTRFSYGLVGRTESLIPLVEKSYRNKWNYYAIGALSDEAIQTAKARLLEMLEKR